MTSQKETSLNPFKLSLERHYQQIESNDPLRKVRSKAWDLFNQTGLPRHDAEVFQYIRLQHLFDQPYCQSHPTSISSEALIPFIYPECRNSFLVFVNGHYCPHLSDRSALGEQISITLLQEAFSTYSALLNNRWTKAMKEEIDPFALVNAVLHKDGAFVYVPPRISVETPLQILHIIDTHESMVVMPRLQTFLGAHAELNLISTTVSLSSAGYFINQFADFHLEEGSHLHYTQTATQHTPNAWHFDATRAHLKRNSSFKSVAIADGGALSRHDYRAVLAGENCEALLNGICMLNGKQEAHTHVCIEHQAPHCRSDQLFKTILSDFSRSSFEGKIYVHREAQKTEAFQLNKNLLLSDRVQANSKPNLEIFADDVKASHGATFGQLDSEQLFYMRTRGMTAVEAKNLLVYGFCQEVLDLCSLPSLHKQLTAQAHHYIA